MNQLEQQLCVELRSAEAPYRRALAIIQAALPSGDGTFEEISYCLAQLQPIMQLVEQSENVLGPLKQQWMGFKITAGKELKAALHQHEILLGDLISRINKMEESTQRHRTATLPEMDAVFRHQQMQRAYQQSTRS